MSSPSPKSPHNKSPPPPQEESPPPPDEASSPPPESSPSHPLSPPPPPPSPKKDATPPPPSSYSPTPPERHHPPPPSFSPLVVQAPPGVLPPPITPPPPPPASDKSNNGQDVMTGALVVGLVFFVAMIGVCIMWKRSRKRRKQEQYDTYWHHPYGGGGGKEHTSVNIRPMGPPHHLYQQQQEGSNKLMMNSSASSGGPSATIMVPSLGMSKSSFSYEELAAATSGFSQLKMLGQGGFGYVHKGVLLNGKEVAVKSLKAGSGQGEREFQSEVEIISRVHHRHLVSLVGYCIAGEKRMLVYEYVPNNNLEHHLHEKDNPPLDFSTRLRIALGSAKGLAYLHEDCHPRIIHRDIKASNILLDYHFEAQVADFGLAKLTSDTNTHVSTRVMGTFGYLAPESASSGKLTEKSDVFSFGVMLLELITGRRPVDPDMKYMEDSLVDWAKPLCLKALSDGNYNELADPRLQRNYDAQQMARMVTCASACIRHSAKKRPRMSQIVRALEGDVSLDDLHDGKQGNTLINNNEGGTEVYDTRAYSADLKKFRQLAFETQEFGGNTTDAAAANASNPNPNPNPNPTSSSSSSSSSDTSTPSSFSREMMPSAPPPRRY